jgi:hypothetical protein
MSKSCWHIIIIVIALQGAYSAFNFNHAYKLSFGGITLILLVEE